MFVPPTGLDGPYSAPMSTGLSYSRLDLPFGFAAGATAAYTGFYPRTVGFGRSRMITWAAELGYPVQFDLGADSFLLLVPTLGTGLYHRWFEFESDWLYAARPIATAKIGLALITRARASLGLSIQAVLYFDNTVRLTAGVGQSAGVVF